MRRPLWILALLLALLVAGIFAWLGQWQMSNAIRTSADPVVETEEVRPLSDASIPSEGVAEEGAGVVVKLDGAFDPENLSVVTQRENAGTTGVWVVGNFVTEGPNAASGANLAVAIGWAPDVGSAERAISEFEADPDIAQKRAIEGRYMPAEAVSPPKADEDPRSMNSMVPAYLVNAWSDVNAPIYSGYLVMHPTDAVTTLLDPLDPIDSVTPVPPEAVSWLNVFYAVEWVVFAGFAVFFWFRLTRDAWEKEHELKLMAEGEDQDQLSGPDTLSEPQ